MPDAEAGIAADAGGHEPEPAEAVEARAGELPDDGEDAGREAPEAEPVAPPVADEVLLAAVDLARGALLEVTPAQTVGSVIGHVAEGERVLTLRFAADLLGYPGWHWSVTLARVEDGTPTVLETELMPGELALLAPEWVPWSERLADYRAAQAAAAEAEPGGADDELDDADESEDDADAVEESDDFGDDDSGDDAFDGIDIDALDGDADADADGDEESGSEPDAEPAAAD